MKQNSSHVYKIIPYTTIETAVSGDVDAVYAVLEHYKLYIRKIATSQMYDKTGTSFVGVDETLVNRMETKLIAKLMTFHLT